jgi:hypothetical protein
MVGSLITPKVGRVATSSVVLLVLATFLLGASPARAAGEQELSLGVPGAPFAFQSLDPPLTVATEGIDDQVVTFEVPDKPGADGVTAIAVTEPIDFGALWSPIDKEFLAVRWRQAGAWDPFVTYRFADGDAFVPLMGATIVASDATAQTWQALFPKLQHARSLQLSVAFKAFDALPTPGRLEDITIAYRKWVKPPPGGSDNGGDTNGHKHTSGTGGGSGSGVYAFPSGSGSGSGGSGSGSGGSGSGGSGSGGGTGVGSGSGQPAASAGATSSGQLSVPAAVVPVSGVAAVTGQRLDLTASNTGSGSASGDAGWGGTARSIRSHGSALVALVAAAVAGLVALIVVPGVTTSRRLRRLRRFDDTL